MALGLALSLVGQSRALAGGNAAYRSYLTNSAGVQITDSFGRAIALAWPTGSSLLRNNRGHVITLSSGNPILLTPH